MFLSPFLNVSFHRLIDPICADLCAMHVTTGPAWACAFSMRFSTLHLALRRLRASKPWPRFRCPEGPWRFTGIRHPGVSAHFFAIFLGLCTHKTAENDLDQPPKSLLWLEKSDPSKKWFFFVCLVSGKLREPRKSKKNKKGN